MIPHSRPTISSDDKNAVGKVLESGYIAQGEKVSEFENRVSSFVKVKGGAAVSSGTAALHLALMALGVKEGDEVILPSYVCVAPLNAIYYVKAKPLLAEVDLNTGNIDPESTRQLISQKTKAIIIPHMFGNPAPIDRFKEFGIPIIEDCAQALGAAHQGHPIGSFGDIAICSFYATKVIATGEGGMVLSNNEGYLEKVREMREYDERIPYKTRFNYKMTDMEAALGISQLKQLPEFVVKRREIASFYNETLAGLPVEHIGAVSGSEPMCYRYVFRVKKGVDDFIERMGNENVSCCRPVFKPIHQLLAQEGMEHTDSLYKEAVSIPIYPLLTGQQMEQVASAVKKILTH